jgi:hypothetical protein
MTSTNKYSTNLERQDSAFYTDDDTQVVWEAEGNPFYVLRCGEMRIHARKNIEDEPEVIRYTDRLESFGIKTDADLAEWTDKGEEYFDWVNNSWFEVVHEVEGDYYSDPFHSLNDAIEHAIISNENVQLLEQGNE